jgi:hypothetical protein
MNLSNPVNARFRFYRRNRRLSTCSPATGTAFLGLSLIPCSFFKDRLPSWQYQTISLGTLFIIEFMSIVKGKVCFLTIFRDSFFQGAVLHEQTAIIAACSIMSRAKNHPISINLRFAVLAHSNTLTLLSHL